MAKNDAFLWYNVGEWAEHGLAVPNYGNDLTSQNDTIRNLTEVVGRNLQAIMFHPDSRLRTPPSINTLTRLHKLCTRARSILAGRAVAPSTPNLEPAHALPSPEQFLVFPAPYFRVRNTWLKQYAGLALLCLTEAMQHQENARPIEISTTFAGHVGQYLHRIYRLMSTELFRVPLAEAEKLDFTLSDEQLKSYNPGQWFTQTEMIDTVPSLADWPTEDTLEVLTNGIAVGNLPNLPTWPSSGAPTGTQAGATGVLSGESFAPPMNT